MSKDTFPVCILDCFIREGHPKFNGNPAAVCILNRDEDIDNEKKQRIANELNQSITVFLSRGWSITDKESTAWTIRWFTTTVEISLCGHGTLAAAYIIFSKLKPNSTLALFEASSGEIVETKYDSDTGIISLNFPSFPPKPLIENENESGWLERLVKKVTQTASRNAIVEDIQYSASGGKILLKLKMNPEHDSGEVIRSVTPDLKGMMDVVPKNLNLIGLAVTIQNNKFQTGEPLFYSRFFAPWAGMDEDPVCGSLHSVLTPYWSQLLGKSSETLLSRFESPRTGDVYVKLEDNRVLISGRVGLNLEGTFHL